MDIKIPQTLAEWNAAGAEYLPGHLGLTFVKVVPTPFRPRGASSVAFRSTRDANPLRPTRFRWFNSPG